jgi:hypothetical protein
MNNWQETGLPFCITDTRITITLPNGQPKSVLKTDKTYELVLLAIKENRWKDIPDLVNPAKLIESKYAFKVENDKVFIGNEEVPWSLSKRIIDFAKANLPVEPLLKFWSNLNLNPSFHSVQQLHEFLDKNDHPITPDGCFLAYRRVRDDFKDIHSGTMDNSVGNTVSMPRNKVNEDPNQTCSNGLHVANFDYACNLYAGREGRLLLVKINPKDVVAVPVDYNQAKMRVCEFVVLDEIHEELTKTPLYDDGSALDCSNPPQVLATEEETPVLDDYGSYFLSDDEEIDEEYDDY